MPKDWWKKLESVNIRIMGQQGFILNRYTVYEIASDVSLTFCNSTRSISHQQILARFTRRQAVLRIRILVGLSRSTISFPAPPCFASKKDTT